MLRHALRNIALVAHIDSGKTTLTESILLKSHFLTASGSVDTGTTTTDFLPAERQRGITIQAASIPVKWNEYTYNLIDTPGHQDFGMEVESASRVIDGAVLLIDSVEGVEAQTRGVWRQLEKYNVPTRLVFMNKLDRPGASYRRAISSLLTHRFHPHPMPLTLPIASFDPQDYAHAEPGIQGIVDLVNWKVHRWDNETGESSVHPVDYISPSHPISSVLIPARTALLENLAMFSEELMESLLEEDESSLFLHPDKILHHLRQATLKRDILPVLCGSAIKHIGTELLLDYVGALLATPLDVSPDSAAIQNEPLRLLAWKVTWDPKKGWMTFIRVYGGTLTKNSSIFNTNRNVQEKVSKLLLLYASQTEEVNELPFGSVGVVLGLKYTRTGDTLVAASAPRSSRSSMRNIVPPPAVVSAAVIPHSHSDLEPVQTALANLARTDPSVRVDIQEGQILVHGLGSLHLEIVQGRLRDEWQVKFEFGQRRVAYRERFISSIPPADDNKGQVMVGGASVSLSLDIRPLGEDDKADPSWDGNVVVDAKGRPFRTPDSHSGSPETFIATGIASALSNSPHSSLPLSGMLIQVESFITPPQISLLTSAAAILIRDHIRKVGMGYIMEPFFSFEVSAPEEVVGKVIKDLTEHGGEIQDMAAGISTEDDAAIDDAGGGYDDALVYLPPASLSPAGLGGDGDDESPHLKRTVRAIAPLSRMLDYSNRLRAISGGHGQFTMSNAGFREVSESRKMEILRELGRA